jgi:hypothetical protein
MRGTGPGDSVPGPFSCRFLSLARMAIVILDDAVHADAGCSPAANRVARRGISLARPTRWGMERCLRRCREYRHTHRRIRRGTTLTARALCRVTTVFPGRTRRRSASGPHLRNFPQGSPLLSLFRWRGRRHRQRSSMGDREHDGPGVCGFRSSPAWQGHVGPSRRKLGAGSRDPRPAIDHPDTPTP